MRKCNKCGCNIPDGNKVCNNCGTPVGLFTTSTTFVSKDSYAKSAQPNVLNSNDRPFGGKKQNNYNNSNNGNNSAVKFIVGFFVFMFIMPFIVGIISVIIMFNSAEDMIDDFEYEDTEYLTDDEKCQDYCIYGEYKIENDECKCSSGFVYDMEGNYLRYEMVNNDPNINHNDTPNLEGLPTDMVNWYNDIKDGKTVVTVFGSKTCPYCQQYKPLITNYTNIKNYPLYFFEFDDFTVDESIFLTDTFELKEYNEYIPYTFITKDNKVLAEHTGLMYEGEITNFFKDAGL